MSFQAMSWATEQDVSAMQKIVLLMLANCANHVTGQCNPSYDRLAKDCGMSMRSCKEQIAILADKGLLEIKRRVVDGVYLPNQYVLHIGEGVVQQAPEVVRQIHEGSAQNALGVVRQMHTKQEIEPGIEPVKTKTKRSSAASGFDPLNFLLGNGVSKQIALDWLQVRRKKRAADTHTAFSDVIAKIRAANLSCDDALKICCTRGWAGFDAEWLKPQQSRAGPVKPAKFDPLTHMKNQREAKAKNERTIEFDAVGEPI